MDKFKAHVLWVRKIMPSTAMLTTALSYAVAALVIGYLLNTTINNIWISYGIAVASQLVRMVIVFFGQLNPKTPDFGYIREGIAGAFGAFTIYEVWGLGTLNGWPTELKISLTILMLGGTIIEVMLLRSIKTYNRKEIMTSPDTLAEIQNEAIQYARHRLFMAKMSEIESGDADISDILTNERKKANDLDQSRMQSLETELYNVKAANRTLQSSPPATPKSGKPYPPDPPAPSKSWKENKAKIDGIAKDLPPTPPAPLPLASSRPQSPKAETDDEYDKRVKKNGASFDFGFSPTAPATPGK
jgi:hypothetical protein